MTRNTMRRFIFPLVPADKKHVSDQDENDVGERTVIVTAKLDAKDQKPQIEPYLIQISGRQTGQQINLSGRDVKIGRDNDSCEVVVDDPHVSRQHAEIVWKEGKPFIRDLGSTNGIVINGTRIQEQELFDNDKILIGTRLYFKFCYQDTHEQNYQQTLFNAANIDTLTGLYSRKFFQDILSKEFSFSKRNRQPLSLLMIDIDHFKKINDTHGHLGGDEVLRKVGQTFKMGLRMENIAARYGGEEFAIILRNVHADLALQIGERLRKTIESEKMMFKETRIPVTISVGIATLDGDNYETGEDLVQAADELLYEAKETGRNKTVLKKVA